MAQEEINKKMEELRASLKTVEALTKELQKEGVTLYYNIASEQKTVEVKSKTVLEITVKGNINQDL